MVYVTALWLPIVVAAFGLSEDGRSILHSVLALVQARARYRIYPDGDRSLLPDLSYSRGDRIVAAFLEERLVRVDIVGEGDGVYLEALRRREP